MKRLFAFILSGVLPLMLMAAKAPTDDQLKALCREAGFAMQNATTDEAKQQAFDALTTKLESQADLAKITAQQVEMAFDVGGVTLQPYLERWLAPTLEAKAAKDGGMFSFLCWKFMPRKEAFHIDSDEVSKLKRFLDDSGMAKIVEQQNEVGRDIINGLSSFKYKNWSEPGFIESTLKFLAAKMPDAATMEVVKVFNAAMLGDSLGSDTYERLRKATLALYQRLEKAAPSERIKKNAREQIDYLEGPFAKGTLIGSKAPELHFLRYIGQEWKIATSDESSTGSTASAATSSSNGEETIEEIEPAMHILEPATQDIKTLQSLYESGNGPVIMLDFWGTKCVPCIQSFPELAEVQKQFYRETERKQFLMIGITSLQGYFVDTPNHKTIQTRNNPEKELGLFPDFMKGMNINWHIAITEEDVMNTDYGVLAIPHVVLIDKKGNVRYNNLSADKEEKIALIKQLLAE